MGNGVVRLKRNVLAWVTWQRVPVSGMRIADPRREAVTAILYAVCFVGVSWATGLMIRSHPLPVLGAASLTDDFWYIVVFKLGFLLGIPLLWFHRRGYRLTDLMPGWRADRRRILTLAVCFFVGASANLLQGRLGLIPEAAARFSTGGLVLRLGLGLLVPLLQAGFPEEFCFRGILQTRLERVWGRGWAIFGSVILFTAWHIPTRYLLSVGVEGTAGDFGSVVMGTGVPVFIVGLIFALFWDRYRSLLPLVAAHWGVDVLPSLRSFLGVGY
jgi:membrane protease YdiL (CAAX protease family)